MNNLFTWLDDRAHTHSGKIINQLIPVGVCLFLLAAFVVTSQLMITQLINPFSQEKIVIQFLIPDIIAGFLLYFFTAIDYALIIGRMQVVNTGSKARFVMNVFTCVGCFVGVSLVLFLWGFAKEVVWLIIPILIFAGAVMIRLAYEGREYFEHSPTLPPQLRTWIIRILRWLFVPAHTLTHWMPEINTPRVTKMSLMSLMKWSFLLPFIIGTDDLVGYMGAMTIYNVFSLLFGIYLADILIDIFIFVSPSLTKKLVENPYLSLAGTAAFLYLAYKSLSEATLLTLHNWHNHQSSLILAYLAVGLFVAVSVIQLAIKKKNK